MSDDSTLYEKVISENDDKGSQLRLVVSEYRGQQYIHLRKYFLSYEGDWVPTKEGATMPATIQSVFALLDGLIELCSKEETESTIIKYFAEKLKCLESTNT
jgi:hypothetical protein